MLRRVVTWRCILWNAFFTVLLQIASGNCGASCLFVPTGFPWNYSHSLPLRCHCRSLVLFWFSIHFFKNDVLRSHIPHWTRDSMSTRLYAPSASKGSSVVLTFRILIPKAWNESLFCDQRGHEAELSRLLFFFFSPILAWTCWALGPDRNIH